MSADVSAARPVTLAALADDPRVMLEVAEVHLLTGLSEAHLRRNAPIKRVGSRTLIPRAWVDALASVPADEVAS